MHDKLPEPNDDEMFFRVKAQGGGAKPITWHGYVLAGTGAEARKLIQDSNAVDLIGLQGLRRVSPYDKVGSDMLAERLLDAANPNEVLFEEGGEVQRVHRGDLKEDD